MENDIVPIRWSAVPGDDKTLLVPWSDVITHVEARARSIVGSTMQNIEMLGLPAKQEDAIKAILKRLIYDSSNDMLDSLSTWLEEVDDVKYLKPYDFKQETLANDPINL